VAEMVGAEAGAWELAKARLGGAEEGALAVRLGDVQRQAVDPPADRCIATSEQERRRNAEFAGNRERPPLACEEMARQAKTPPRDFIDAAQHCLDVTGAASEAPAFHRRKRVALEHHARRPAALDVARQTHGALFRRDGAIVAADPAREIDESSLRKRALFREPLLRAAQSLPVLAPERMRERRKQTKIDVHRLVRARAGGGLDMAG